MRKIEEWSGPIDLNHRPPGPEKGGRKHLSAASGIAYGSFRPFTLPSNWTEVGRNLWGEPLSWHKFLGHSYLAGDHDAGRREIAGVLKCVEEEGRKDGNECDELLFYSYRYLSISFHRDQNSGSVEKAGRYLALASEIVAKYEIKSNKWKELSARLNSNRGNLALAAGDVSSALDHYRKSLDMFVQLGDSEHEGIAHLKIAEASLYDAGLISDVTTARHLDTAESIFMRLGWKEGHARVWEQRSQRAIGLSKSTTDVQLRSSLLDEAVIANRNAYSLYESIQNSRGLGRIESLFKQVEDEKRAMR